ncbi:hypothetical protein [Streptomyces montanisoli]|uniref:Uncharacterized protein n=1 Tax=Streptomyces montanisoli TaxID=2798581 RepID=A0A940MDE7_9ACTN|nr:hypothetical protein [Streptomyces montanisoli]MBP0458336.1 hypothetical protein [Streptomyces montanisoli]
MGTHDSEGGTYARQSAGPTGPVPEAAEPITSAELEAALGNAMCDATLDAHAQQQAVAAYRAARDAGLHEQARARRGDDWRSPRTPVRRSVRIAVAALLASLALGGAAFAAIELPKSSGGGTHHDAPRPTGSGPAATSDASSPAHANTPATAGPSNAPPSGSAGSSAGSRSTGRPPTAKDIQAHCRAYASVKGHGKALDSPGWQRFIAAAGGEDHVSAYCAHVLPDSGSGSGSGSGKQQGRKASPEPKNTSASKKPGQAKQEKHRNAAASAAPSHAPQGSGAGVSHGGGPGAR